MKRTSRSFSERKNTFKCFVGYQQGREQPVTANGHRGEPIVAHQCKSFLMHPLAARRLAVISYSGPSRTNLLNFFALIATATLWNGSYSCCYIVLNIRLCPR